MRWRWGEHTATGPMRARNEDATRGAALPRGVVALVADGSGGHEGLAAACLQAMVDYLVDAEPEDRLTRAGLDATIEAARGALPGPDHHAVWDGACTLAGILTFESQLRVFWLGELQVWRLRDGRLERLGSDHLLVTMMVAAGKLTAGEARTSPHRNIVMRALLPPSRAGGDPENSTADCTEVLGVQGGDRYLLLSDGIWRPLSPLDLLELAQTGEPAAVARVLVEEAHRREGSDSGAALVLDAAG